MTKHTPLNIIGVINQRVRVWKLCELCISLSASCWCYRWTGRGHAHWHVNNWYDRTKWNVLQEV